MIKCLVVLVLFLMSTAHAADVWFTSNVGTKDFLNMFSQPQLWEKARSKINVIKFYNLQLLADSEAECPLCEQNLFQNFLARNAFEKN